MLQARPSSVRFLSILGATSVAHLAWKEDEKEEGKALWRPLPVSQVTFPYLHSLYNNHLSYQVVRLRHFLLGSTFLNSPRCEALLREEDKAYMSKINTNVYVWGEGFQVDPTQEYSNFTPKKIQQFKGGDKANIVDVAFGWYHEAYIDSKGKLFVCAKAKLPSIEVEGLRDGDRADIVEVKNLPRGTKVKQVAFT